MAHELYISEVRPGIYLMDEGHQGTGDKLKIEN